MSAVETPAATVSGTWTVDPAHSHVEFAAKHLGFATVKGRAQVFSGTFAAGETAALEGTVDLASVTTHEPDRDVHLRSPDFFDVARFPEARLVSTAVALDGDAVAVEGELTLKGTTRPVSLRGSLTGAGADPWGNERLGLELEGTIDRREFGVDWNQPLPGGGLLVSNEVRLGVALSVIRAA